MCVHSSRVHEEFGRILGVPTLRGIGIQSMQSVQRPDIKQNGCSLVRQGMLRDAFGRFEGILPLERQLDVAAAGTDGELGLHGTDLGVVLVGLLPLFFLYGGVFGGSVRGEGCFSQLIEGVQGSGVGIFGDVGILVRNVGGQWSSKVDAVCCLAGDGQHGVGGRDVFFVDWISGFQANS